MADVDLGSRKSLFIVVVVVGCFAVLWPKVLHPMMVGPSSVNHHRIKPSNLDQGCCDVISDIDINTIKIMNELCNNIIHQSDIKPLRGQDIVKYCRTEILQKCGIDISAVLQEQIRLGHPFKRIVDELRSFNGSSCLKYNFGIAPWSLGVPHKVTINLTPINVRQERPAHMKPEMLHPALRERGSAIPQSYPAAEKKAQNVKYVEGRPGPIPGMRPTMGGGHIVQPQKGLNSMGIVMPLYTIGIVIFFSYTLMKIVFRKRPEGPGKPLYPPVDPSPIFKKEVFECQKSKVSNATPSCKLGDEELDNLRQRLRDTELIMERIVAQMSQVPLRSQKEQPNILVNGSAKQASEQPSVTILGMQTTASCEGGQKWSRPDSPVIPTSPPPPPVPTEPPQEIYLEGALPAQSQLLVADAVTESEMFTNDDPAVILASKMTLSVINVDKSEANEKFLTQNGNLVNADEKDDALEDSKYTTASCITDAEPDVSEDEQTDDEMDKLPEYVVDNGIQQINLDHTDDDEDDIDIEEEEEEEEEEDIENWVEEPKESERNVQNDLNDNINTTENMSQSLNIHHIENINENENFEENHHNGLSANSISEHIASLTDLIDDIVNSEAHSTQK